MAKVHSFVCAVSETVGFVSQTSTASLDEGDRFDFGAWETVEASRLQRSRLRTHTTEHTKSDAPSDNIACVHESVLMKLATIPGAYFAHLPWLFNRELGRLAWISRTGVSNQLFCVHAQVAAAELLRKARPLLAKALCLLCADNNKTTP